MEVESGAREEVQAALGSALKSAKFKADAAQITSPRSSRMNW